MITNLYIKLPKNGNSLKILSDYKTKKEFIMLTKDELPNCPVATTIQLIGNKWKLFIIQQLLNG